MNMTRTVRSARFLPAFLIVLGFGSFAKAELITGDTPLTGKWADPKNPGDVIVFKPSTGTNSRGDSIGRFYIPGKASGQYTYVGDSISGKVILESSNGSTVTVTKMAAVPVGRNQLKLTRFGSGSSTVMDRVQPSPPVAGGGILYGLGGRSNPYPGGWVPQPLLSDRQWVYPGGGSGSPASMPGFPPRFGGSVQVGRLGLTW